MNFALIGSPEMTKFVDISVALWGWVALLATLTTMLAIDLIRHRDDHETTTKEALTESIVWVACGLLFSLVIAFFFGSAAFSEYLSGYLIEKSLSVDNVFVWAMIFSSMAIPLKYQHRVLFWGIFGALALRAIFIFTGSALINRFWWLLIVFGLFLIFTGIKVFRHRSDTETKENSRGLKLLNKFMPSTDQFHGHSFTIKQAGKRVATPLLGALVVVELTDLVFAVDSVPAILAVSHEPFIVFASNAFAILGLRAMYFLLANAKEKFYYLSHALGGILVFVGIKMSITRWYHMNTYISLMIIIAMLVVAIILSMRKNNLPRI